ncbi:MAG: pentapeptide repeat-containing protein [Acidimicrobiales bacterium]
MNGPGGTPEENTGVGPGSVFTDANLTGTVFLSVGIGEANFTDANLTGAMFQSANLRDVNFTSANLTDVKFVNGTDLTGARFTGASLSVVASWIDVTCPDGTNSDNDGATCANDLG